MTTETHFVQAGAGPVLIGAGGETLTCECGQILVQGFSADRFLGIGIACGRCGSVTTTAVLPDGAVPPRSAIVAAPSAAPRETAMTIPAGATLIGHAEM